MRQFQLFFLLSICIFSNLSGQIKKVFFVGNSYTAYNNLPQMIKDLALSTGDTLMYSSSTPGGMTLMGHSTTSASTTPILQGGYHFVVLQDQSQLWSFPQSQVDVQATPYVGFFDSLTKVSNASTCGQTLLYMTWGRQNGDASNCANWPPVCTYLGMDSLLRLRALQFQSMYNTSISPVGAVWRYIRSHYPGINLYAGDGSHPSLEGSYAAACTFYTLIFKKNPALISQNLGISSSVANQIKSAAKIIAFDSLFFWRKPLVVNADFNTLVVNGTVTFTNLSTNSISYFWDFGDGTNLSNLKNPIHTYSQNGNYSIKLIAIGCDNKSDTFSSTILIQGLSIPSIEKRDLVLNPNPVSKYLQLQGLKEGDYKYRIINFEGKTLKHEKLNSNFSMDLELLISGAYILELENLNSGQKWFFKFVKI